MDDMIKLICIYIKDLKYWRITLIENYKESFYKFIIYISNLRLKRC